jgi:thiol-disulfide isomerase/thioredoxin
MTLKKAVFYIVAAIFIFAGQFLTAGGQVTGTPPVINKATMDGGDAMAALARGPALIYFWAEWCGVCRGMQHNVTAVLQDTPGMTIAVRSGDDRKVGDYMRQNNLPWPVVNDADGAIGQRYGVAGVPALYILDKHGAIVFTSAGYTTEPGLRFRLWLAGLL